MVHNSFLQQALKINKQVWPKSIEEYHGESLGTREYQRQGPGARFKSRLLLFLDDQGTFLPRVLG